MVAKKLDGMTRRRVSVCAETYDPATDTGSLDASAKHVIVAKSPAQFRRLTSNVGDVLLFRDLDQQQRRRVLDAMFERRVQAGDTVIEEGRDGDNFYVVESGVYDAYSSRHGKKLICSYDEMGSFGEMALMYNMPRLATVVARTDGLLWALDRSTFRRIVLKVAYDKRVRFEAMLNEVAFLKSLSKYEKLKVADSLLSQRYSDGDVILKQNDTADCMYFVESGLVRICARKFNSREVQISKKKVLVF